MSAPTTLAGADIRLAYLDTSGIDDPDTATVGAKAANLMRSQATPGSWCPRGSCCSSGRSAPTPTRRLAATSERTSSSSCRHGVPTVGELDVAALQALVVRLLDVYLAPERPAVPRRPLRATHRSRRGGAPLLAGTACRRVPPP